MQTNTTGTTYEIKAAHPAKDETATATPKGANTQLYHTADDPNGITCAIYTRDTIGDIEAVIVIDENASILPHMQDDFSNFLSLTDTPLINVTVADFTSVDTKTKTIGVYLAYHNRICMCWNEALTLDQRREALKTARLAA